MRAIILRFGLVVVSPLAQPIDSVQYRRDGLAGCMLSFNHEPGATDSKVMYCIIHNPGMHLTTRALSLS